MRRGVKGPKTKTSELHSDVEDEISYSSQAGNNESDTEDTGEIFSSPTKKRNLRGQTKISNNNEKEENGKSLTRKRSKDINDSIENTSDVEDEKSASKKKIGKTDKENGNKKVEKHRKSTLKVKKKGKVEEKERNGNDGEEYEVEKIVKQRTIKGRRQFLVRWKGCTQESDTWEQEKELNCDRLMEEFLAEEEEKEGSAEKESKQGSEKKFKSKISNKNKFKGSQTGDAEDDDEGTDMSKEYEVERIVDVHFKKDKKREFLIRWKGFSSKDDTWEPEENLNCPELIDKFMEKLEKIKIQESRELRTNPAHTNRYTLTMHADKRQTRRNLHKERKTYYECD